MFLALAFTALIGAAQPAPQRVLLLADEASASLEQHSVAQRLVSALLADPHIELVTPAPLPPALQRADALRSEAQRSLAEARSALETLEPFAAARHAAHSVVRLERAATLCGDLGALPDALGVLAAALLHLQAPTRASHTLMRLLVLEPDWQPDPGHFSPEMLRTLQRARAQLRRAPQREVDIDAGDGRAAVFVDGKFINFGAAKVRLPARVPHFVWAQPEHGFAHGARLDIESRSADPLRLTLPNAAQHIAHSQLRFRPLIEASLNPQGYVNAHSALIEGMRIDEVWVLGYDAGMVRLVSFELHSGRRHQVATPALITHLSDVDGAVDTLLRRHNEQQQSLAQGH